MNEKKTHDSSRIEKIWKANECRKKNKKISNQMAVRCEEKEMWIIDSTQIGGDVKGICAKISD